VLGQHSCEILGDLGHGADEDEIDALARSGAVLLGQAQRRARRPRACRQGP